MQTRTASVRDREEKGDAAQKRGAAQKGNNELRPLLFVFYHYYGRPRSSRECFGVI